MTDDDPRPNVTELYSTAAAKGTPPASTASSNGTKSKSKSPKTLLTAPEWGTSLHDLRTWLSEALSLTPPDWIESVEQYGTDQNAAMTVTIRTPQGPRAVRFERASDVGTPAKLRTTFGQATAGRVNVRPMTGPDAITVLLVLCQLASVAETATVADETRGWLAEYVAEGDELQVPLETPEDRHAALKLIRGRSAFELTAQRAAKWMREGLDDGMRWTVLVTPSGDRWVLAREFATFVRKVIGIGRIGQGKLDGLVREAGGERRLLEAEPLPRRVMYCLPAALELQ